MICLWAAAIPAACANDAVRLVAGDREISVIDRPEVCRVKAKGSAGFVIEFADGVSIKDFARLPGTGGEMTTSVGKAGTVTLTRTVLLDEATGTVFVHLHADRPGALGFRVSMENSCISNRRELVAEAGKGTASHLWVLPFESDVEPDDGGIRVRGEGEALIVWAFGKSGTGAELAGAFARVAARHDPGREHPDVSKIWQAVLAGRARARADSP